MFKFLWLLLPALPIFALHESDAGKVDWHKELIGIPRIESATVAPRFEWPAGIQQRSVIITVSKSNVLAAVNTVDSHIVWRHVVEQSDPIGIYRNNPGFVVTLSGAGGANLRSYEAATGQLIFETQLHTPKASLLEPPDIGQDIVFSVDKTQDLFVLTEARTVRRVDGGTGAVKWVWESEDQSSSILLSKLISTESVTYVIGLTKSYKSYTLYVVSLDPSTGMPISSAHVPSSIKEPNDLVGLTSSLLSHPILAWLNDGGHIQTISLSPKINTKSRVVREHIYTEFKDVGISDAGIFVALKRDGTSHVVRVDLDSGTVRKVWEFDDSILSSDHSDPVHAGGIDTDGQPYVARTYWSYAMRWSSFQLFAANGADGRGMVTGFSFPFDPTNHGSIQHFAFEVANPEPNVYVVRALHTTSSGAIQLWTQEKIGWTREESLADINTVEFVDLPEKTVDIGFLYGSNFLARLIRQIGEIRDLPSYIARFTRRFLMGTPALQHLPDIQDSGPLWRDAFGFRKILIAATSTGKIFALDTANGKLVWSRFLVKGSHDGAVRPFKLFTTATASDGKRPEIVLVAHHRPFSDATSTIVYHFEALTGSSIRGNAVESDVLKGFELYSGSIRDAYLIPGENRTVAVVGDDLKIHLYPKVPKTLSSFSGLAPSLHFSLEDYTPSHDRLTGYQIHPDFDDDNGAFRAYPTCTASIHPGERILTVVRRPHEPVASIAKVLGDRSTLFKYLNPHLVAVLTTSRASPIQCSVYLVDSAKGTVIYHAVVPPVHGICSTRATLTENWLLYHYYDEGLQTPNGIKGYRMVSVEVYEGSGIDDKTRSSDMTTFSYDNSIVTVFQRSFVFPHDITAMTTTTTKFGISTKDIIISNSKQQIQTFPRRLFDPRRPEGKPTAQEQEEWLIQYDPLIPDDTRWVLSHNYRVAGTRKIVTSPAQLESTSIVFTYGLDLFLTRVAPSSTFDILSESFNKTQLVLIVTALSLSIIIVRPIVRRKLIKQRWHYL